MTTRPAPSDMPPPRAPSVLCIDDAPIHSMIVLRLVADVLGGAACEVRSTMTDGLAYLKSNQVDLVVLDGLLPEGSGAGVVSAIRQQQDHEGWATRADVPVIVLSAAMPDDLEEAGFRFSDPAWAPICHMPKPPQVARLQAQLRAYLGV